MSLELIQREAIDVAVAVDTDVGVIPDMSPVVVSFLLLLFT